MERLVIKAKDIKTRKTWGKVKPFSRKFVDQKKEANRKACRARVSA